MSVLTAPLPALLPPLPQTSLALSLDPTPPCAPPAHSPQFLTRATFVALRIRRYTPINSSLVTAALRALLLAAIIPIPPAHPLSAPRRHHHSTPLTPRPGRPLPGPGSRSRPLCTPSSCAAKSQSRPRTAWAAAAASACGVSSGPPPTSLWACGKRTGVSGQWRHVLYCCSIQFCI